MRAVVAVGRVGRVAAGVANARSAHAVELADQILDTPKASAGKDRLLGCSHLPLLLVMVPWFPWTYGDTGRREGGFRASTRCLKWYGDDRPPRSLWTTVAVSQMPPCRGNAAAGE